MLDVNMNRKSDIYSFILEQKSMDLVCRTCLHLTTNKDIDLKNDTELIVKIELLIGIQITIQNKSPSNICARCVEKIDDFIKFRHLVIDTDSRIRQYSSAHNKLHDVKIEFDEPQIKKDIDFETEVYVNSKISVEPHEGISKQTECLGMKKEQTNPINEQYEKNYVCSYCNTVFSQRKYLLIHKRIHLQNKTGKSLQPNISLQEDEIYNSDSDEITADQLQEPCSLVQEDNIEIDIKSEKKHGSETLSEKKPKKLKVEHVNKINKILHSQAILPDKIKKGLNSNDKFKGTGKKKYECPECGEIFSQRKQCYNHRHRNHLRRICSVCGVSVRSDHLPKHMQIHLDDPIACKICKKVFKNSLSLRGHINLHKGLKYECDKCKRVFKAKNEYHRHLKVHEDPNLRKYSCEICGKIVCDIRRHMLTHTGEKPYICKFCEKGFCSSYSLKIHGRQHTNEKPFVCEYCSMGFPQKVSLVTHLKSKHGKMD